MDSNLQNSPNSSDAKTAFRKPSTDSSNRQYRRRSPVSGLSSSEGLIVKFCSMLLLVIVERSSLLNLYLRTLLNLCSSLSGRTSQLTKNN